MIGIALAAGVPVTTPAPDVAIEALLLAGVQFRRDLSRAFWKDVSHLKVTLRVGLADCVCAALARQLGAELVTADHPDFDPMDRQGICRVQFIR